MRRVVKPEVQPTVREGAVARRIAAAALQDDHANAEEITDVELITSLPPQRWSPARGVTQFRSRWNSPTMTFA